MIRNFDLFIIFSIVFIILLICIIFIFIYLIVLYGSLFRFLTFGLVFMFLSCKKDCPKEECAGIDLRKGLIAYYPFNGNANDESGNGNNGIAVNGAHFATDMIGKPGKAAEFDGVDDYFVVMDNGKLNSASLTVSMMVLVKNTNRRHSFISRAKFENTTGGVWGLGQSLDATNVFDFIVKDKAEDCTVPHVYDPALLVSAPEQMIAWRWYNIIMTFGEGKQNLFIDGQLRGSKQRSFTELKQCSSADLVIGGWWKNDIISVDGKVDEIRIYNRVIDNCEINKLSEVFR